MVHVSPVRLVDDLARGGVLLVVGDIVVHHDDDVVVRDSVGVYDLVGMTDVCLVTIVEPSVTAGNQKHPQFPVLVRGVCRKENISGLFLTSGVSGRSSTERESAGWR